MTSGHTCLVTGAAGFIGSHLCDLLLKNGHRVIAWDNLRSGSYANLAQLKSHPDFTFAKHDVTKPHHVPHKVSRIYNLACPASPIQYAKDPVHTLKTCVWGAMHLLEQARRTGARILQASTSEVYGCPLEHPQTEGYWGHVNPFGPRACYDEGKRAAEALFYDFHHSHNVDVRIARIFNTYGPRMAPDDGRVISSLIVQALSGHPLTVFGTGLQTRSFCFVTDTVDGLYALMESDVAGAHPINLGNPNELTMQALAQKVLQQTKSTSEIVHKDLPQNDPKQRCPDISRAKQVLAWQPCVGLSEGLERTIASFRRCIEVFKS